MVVAAQTIKSENKKSSSGRHGVFRRRLDELFCLVWSVRTYFLVKVPKGQS